MSHSESDCSASSANSIEWGNLTQFNFLNTFNSDLVCFQISMQIGLIPKKT